MNLGVFLSPGDSFTKQAESGQLERLVEYYLRPYSRHFDRIFIFSYGDHGRQFTLPKNVILVPKPTLIPNYCYQLLLPLVQLKRIKAINIFRVFQAPGGIPAVITKLLFGKPYVVTYGYDYVKFAQIESRQQLGWLLKLIIRLVLRPADKIIVTDPKNLKFNHSILIPNGVDPVEFRPGQAREPGLVLSVGRLVKQKNYPRLLQAIGLSRRRRKIKLMIIGQGSEHDRLIKLAQVLKVSLQVIPSVTRQQLNGWYQRAEVFALTSRIEGNPKALLEAMSCGCACLTIAFPGNVITDRVTGLVGTGTKSLARKLDLLLTQKALNRALGDRARQVILKSYNIRPLVEQEIKLLKQCSN